MTPDELDKLIAGNVRAARARHPDAPGRPGGRAGLDSFGRLIARERDAAGGAGRRHSSLRRAQDEPARAAAAKSESANAKQDEDDETDEDEGSEASVLVPS